MRGDVTTNFTEMKAMIKDNCLLLIRKLRKMEKFMERHKLPKLTQEKRKSE